MFSTRILRKSYAKLFVTGFCGKIRGKRKHRLTSPINSACTFDTPYMVRGRWIVRSGVGFLGEVGPKAPICKLPCRKEGLEINIGKYTKSQM